MMYPISFLITSLLILFYLHIGSFFSIHLVIQVILEESIKAFSLLFLTLLFAPSLRQQILIYFISVCTFAFIELLLYGVSYFVACGTIDSNFFLVRSPAFFLHLFLFSLAVYLYGEKENRVKLYKIFLLLILIHSLFNIYIW